MNTTIVGVIPVIIVVLATAVAFFAVLIILGILRTKAPVSHYDRMDKRDYSVLLSVVGGFGGLMIIPVIVGALLPFDTKYYNYYSVTGTVTSVSNTLTDASGDLTSSPVILLDNGNIPIVVDDPRIVTFKDREVELLCTVSWKYLAEDQWRCQIRDGGY